MSEEAARRGGSSGGGAAARKKIRSLAVTRGPFERLPLAGPIECLLSFRRRGVIVKAKRPSASQRGRASVDGSGRIEVRRSSWRARRSIRLARPRVLRKWYRNNGTR